MKRIIAISIMVIAFSFTAAVAGEYSVLYSRYYRMGIAAGADLGRNDSSLGTPCNPGRYAGGFRAKARKFARESASIINSGGGSTNWGTSSDVEQGLMDGYYEGYNLFCK